MSGERVPCDHVSYYSDCTSIERELGGHVSGESMLHIHKALLDALIYYYNIL